MMQAIYPSRLEFDRDDKAPNVLKQIEYVGMELPFKLYPGMAGKAICLNVVNASQIAIAKLQSCGLRPIIQLGPKSRHSKTAINRDTGVFNSGSDV